MARVAWKVGKAMICALEWQRADRARALSKLDTHLGRYHASRNLCASCLEALVGLCE